MRGRPDQSATLPIECDIFKTDQILSIRNCVLCDGMKSMIVSDRTLQAGRPGKFFRKIGNVSAKTRI